MLIGKLTKGIETDSFWSLAMPPIQSFLQMKPPKRLNLKTRAAEKIASRREDNRRLENGESPEVLQRENSIFPPEYFEKHRVVNFASVIGK